MLNLIIILIKNFYHAPYYILKMRKYADHPKKYSFKARYDLARKVISVMNRSAKISTKAYGLENLPKSGGYMMYPNHQGKYDVLGIMITHDVPCSFVMDKDKSYTMITREFTDLVQGKRLEINNPRQGIKVINQVSKEVAGGKIYILFPEGGYTFNNKNTVGEFKPGSFKIALKSKVPIVPVALVDSYKVYNSFHLGSVQTSVYYLEPILYDEYKNMKTVEIAKMVQERISKKISEVSH